MQTTLCGLLLLLAFGCRHSSSDQTDSKSTTSQSTGKTSLPAVDTVCFRQVMNRDTTTLQLIVKEGRATGYLDNNPFEKDRARGPFEGNIDGERITADWQRAGEGVVQHYTLDLTNKGNTITWREGERVEKEGKWALKQPDSGYQYVLTKIDCPATSRQ